MAMNTRFDWRPIRERAHGCPAGAAGHRDGALSQSSIDIAGISHDIVTFCEDFLTQRTPRLEPRFAERLPCPRQQRFANGDNAGLGDGLPAVHPPRPETGRAPLVAASPRFGHRFESTTTARIAAWPCGDWELII